MAVVSSHLDSVDIRVSYEHGTTPARTAKQVSDVYVRGLVFWNAVGIVPHLVISQAVGSLGGQFERAQSTRVRPKLTVPSSSRSTVCQTALFLARFLLCLCFLVPVLCAHGTPQNFEPPLCYMRSIPSMWPPSPLNPLAELLSQLFVLAVVAVFARPPSPLRGLLPLETRSRTCSH